MDVEWMRQRLPEKPPEDFQEWLQERLAVRCPGYLVFSSERQQIGWEEHRRSVWVARCKCTACREEFETMSGTQSGKKGFRMYMGDDGQLWPTLDGEDDEYGTHITDMEEGDAYRCQWCETQLTVIHSGSLRGGRTNQLLGGMVQNIGAYTAFICYLAFLKWNEYGTCAQGVYPRDAYVLTEEGRLQRFRHTKGVGWYGENRTPEWEACNNTEDSFCRIYHDWGSIENRLMGGHVWEQVRIEAGQTGEKTGLERYVRDGGNNVVAYLKMWRKFPCVENLVNAGWTEFVEDTIEQHTGYSPGSLCTELSNVDTTKKKPQAILRMSKEDLRVISARKHKWTAEQLRRWVQYLKAGGRQGAVEFEEFYSEAHYDGFDTLLELRKEDAQIDIPALRKYMEKQNMRLDRLRYLKDARNMARELHPDRALTEEELWPRRLGAVHDRLANMISTQANAAKNAQLQAGFDAVRLAFGNLEWTNGELCLKLPESNQDLIREGSVLRHCVGGYGKGHTEGTGVIFFVRRYRRPERSYFTLDINMTGVPREVQLHGYKNENVRPGKKRKIPPEVRAFVDQWKTEILMPWYLQQINSKEKTA